MRRGLPFRVQLGNLGRIREESPSSGATEREPLRNKAGMVTNRKIAGCGFSD